jgi:hypothetical protein
MGRLVIGMCGFFGSAVGSYVPVVLWHASSFGVASLLFGGVGAVAGIVVGARVSDL